MDPKTATCLVPLLTRSQLLILLCSAPSSQGKGRAPVYFNQRTEGWLVSLVNDRASRSLDVYEFGVYTGDRMADFARRMRGFGHLWGFDSFTGFPDEPSGVWQVRGEQPLQRFSLPSSCIPPAVVPNG